jgi:dihydroxyacetone kinase
VARSLQTSQSHNLEKVADVEAGCGGVEADIAGYRAGGKMVTRALARAVDEAAPLEIVKKVGRHCSSVEFVDART